MTAAGALPDDGLLGIITPERLTGAEPLTDRGAPLGGSVLDFWQWSASDLVSNTARGALAEFLVARALGLDIGARDSWGTYDLDTDSGVKIEVKSSAYIQVWNQTRHSKLSFGCRKTLAWSAETSDFYGEPQRHADVYVFAVLSHKDQGTFNPLDVSQWDFYVVPTHWLDETLGDQKTVGLGTLCAGPHGTPVAYRDLAASIGTIRPRDS